MKMNLKPAFYYVMRSYRNSAAVFLAVMIAIMTVVCVISAANGAEGQMSLSGYGMASAIFALVLGIVGVRENLRILAQFGVSRRTAFWNELLAILALMLILSVFGEFFTAIGQIVSTTQANLFVADTYQLLYIGEFKNALSPLQHLESILLNTVMMILFNVTGQFFSLLFWRLSKFWTIVAAISIPVLLNAIPWGLYALADRYDALAHTGTALVSYMMRSAWNLMGCLVILTAALVGINWLLVRRANIKAPSSK